MDSILSNEDRSDSSESLPEQNENSRQIEEIEALSNVFPEEWIATTKYKKYQMIFSYDETQSVILEVTFTKGYLTEAKDPPERAVSAPFLRGDAKKELYSLLDDTYAKNIGQPIVHKWILNIKDFILKRDKTNAKPSNKKGPVQKKEKTARSFRCPDIYDSDYIEDHKSVFVGHLAKIVHPDQVAIVVEKLKSNKKIADAKHNIVSYRCTVEGRLYEETDDDGEKGASTQMMKLMRKMDSMNVVVVVTRWFGGIQIGNNRFRHINDCTKQLLNEHGFNTTQKTTAKLSADKVKKGKVLRRK